MHPRGSVFFLECTGLDGAFFLPDTQCSNRKGSVKPEHQTKPAPFVMLLRSTANLGVSSCSFRVVPMQDHWILHVVAVFDLGIR